jgi:uncharacterized membrane protein
MEAGTDVSLLFLAAPVARLVLRDVVVQPTAVADGSWVTP